MTFVPVYGPRNCGRMGLEKIVADKEIRELSKNTSVESLVQTLEERLPVP
jgi:hypothetical protein